MLQLILPRCTAVAVAAPAMARQHKKGAGPDLTVTTTWQIYNDVAVVFLGQEVGHQGMSSTTTLPL